MACSTCGSAHWWCDCCPACGGRHSLRECPNPVLGRINMRPAIRTIADWRNFVSNKNLKVRIIGQANTGKTTVAHVIKAALEEQGFKNTALRDLDPTPNKPTIEQRIAALKERRIDIEVVQEPRPSQSKALDPDDPLPVKIRGLHPYRLTSNPHEKIALLLWARQHDGPSEDRGTLPYILGDGVTPHFPSERDWEVANTIIQWLGSPVGRSFVRDLEEQFGILSARIQSS